MKRLNLAVIGCGDIASYLAQVSLLVPHVALTACCDVNEERARAFAKRYRIPEVFSSFEALLAKADIDSVYLAVPHYLHYEMILAAVDAGKSVFVEKPITRTLDEGRKIINAIGNAKVGVNYQYRYDSGCYALVCAVQSGALGRIHSVRINVPWRREKTYFDSAAWHKTIAQAGGGTLITQCSHFLDVALWALGEQPISAMGYTATRVFDVEVDTLTHGIVETSGGTLINITSSMVAAPEQAVVIEVYGENGTVIYKNRPSPSLKTIGIAIAKKRPPVRGIHALQRSLSGFAKWILDGKPYLTPADSALPVLAAVDGIYRSAQSGKRERITC